VAASSLFVVKSAAASDQATHSSKGNFAVRADPLKRMQSVSVLSSLPSMNLSPPPLVRVKGKEVVD
jgi:hypothetical protein